MRVVRHECGVHIHHPCLPGFTLLHTHKAHLLINNVMPFHGRKAFFNLRGGNINIRRGRCSSSR